MGYVESFYQGKDGTLYREAVYTDEAGDPVATVSTDRPRNAKAISAEVYRSEMHRLAAENDMALEEAKARRQAEADQAAAGAAESRQMLSDWLAEAGAPSDLVESVKTL